MASILETLAAKGINTALDLAFRSSPVSCKDVAAGLGMAGAALSELSLKLQDGKITEEEIEDTLAHVGALGNNGVALAVKAAAGRLIEQIL
jgi:hypothetical protein